MKFLFFIFISIFLYSFPLHSQINSKVDNSEIEEINGILCLYKDKNPFTGIILEKWSSSYSETEVKNGLMDGKFIQYNTDGTLRSCYEYKHNKLNGISFDLYENGDTAFVINKFVDNVAKGYIKSYYPNGNINEICYVKEVNKEYLIDNGNKRVGNPILFQRLKLTGCIECYYENGQLEYKICYLKGVLDGEIIGYYPNGNIKTKIHYINGKPIGSSFLYYEDGRLQEENIYDNEGILLNSIKF